MKKIFKTLIILPCLISILCASCTSSNLKGLNIMTFNVRLDAASDSLNNWKYRKDVVAKVVKQYDIDILGAQEVLPNQLKDLLKRLPGYTAVGVGRDFGDDRGEYSALFYKTNRFKAHKTGTFWLSDTPEVPSKGWDGAYPRIATWAVLEDLKSGKNIFAINTHLDHIGIDARIKGVSLILKKAATLAEGLPVILTGDFNSTPDSEIIQAITNIGLQNALVNSKAVAKEKIDKEGTFHDFGRLSTNELEYIDYIFVSDLFEVNFYQVVDEKIDDIYLSDHNPVIAKIAFKQ